MNILSKIKSFITDESGKAKTVIIVILVVVIILILLAVIFRDRIMNIYDQVTQPIGPGGLPPEYYLTAN